MGITKTAPWHIGTREPFKGGKIEWGLKSLLILQNTYETPIHELDLYYLCTIFYSFYLDCEINKK